MSDLNKKHPLIKFESKYSQTEIEFPDVLAYKDQNNMLQPAIYRKQNERQSLFWCPIRGPKNIERCYTLKPSFTDKTDLLSHTTEIIDSSQKPSIIGH